MPDDTNIPSGDISSPTLAATPLASTTPASSPTAAPTPTPSATDRDAALRDQATRVLERWAGVVADAPDAVVLVHELTRGGGWRGGDANDQKVAFEAGRVEAIEPLSADVPPPGEVVWADGSRQSVALVSAADALADMAQLRERYNDVCAACRHLQITGAKLVSVEHMTSRGPALVPAWQFEFVPSERPTHPISHVAVRDRIAPQDAEQWEQWLDSAGTFPQFAAYGRRKDRELTVGFIGGPCAEADRFYGEAVESEVAIVVTVGYRPPAPGCYFANAVGYYLTADLAAPIGGRSVLDLWSGFPLPLLDEEPPDE